MQYPPPQDPYQPPPSQYPYPPQYQPPPPQGPFGLEPRLAALLTYIPFMLGLVASIIFIVTEKHNRLVRFHAIQSLILHIVLLVVSFGGGIFCNIISRIGTAGAIVGFFASLILSLAIFAASLGTCIFLMIKAYNNEMTRLPIIGDLAEKNINLGI